MCVCVFDILLLFSKHRQCLFLSVCVRMKPIVQTSSVLSYFLSSHLSFLSSLLSLLISHSFLSLLLSCPFFLFFLTSFTLSFLYVSSVLSCFPCLLVYSVFPSLFFLSAFYPAFPSYLVFLPSFCLSFYLSCLLSVSFCFFIL